MGIELAFLAWEFSKLKSIENFLLDLKWGEIHERRQDFERRMLSPRQ